jgi:hypothetical protein
MDTIESTTTASTATGTETILPTTIGAFFGGGYYAGRLRVGEETFAIIVAPKSEGEHDDHALNDSFDQVAGAMSFFDGRANTDAHAAAGSELAQWARGLRIGGFDDWYLPSRDELELCYRAFKPTTEKNYCYSGDNPSAVLPAYAYGPAAPAQTPITAFQGGGPEAFDPNSYYWSSTQSAGSEASARSQGFDGGYQDVDRKDGEFRARAVRRLKV